MGAANVIPGVSGGTIAFITGIYERLVGAINNVDSRAVRMLLKLRLKEFWKHIDGTFLLWLLLGVLIATFSLAKLMTVLLNTFPVQTWAFFFGLIIASSILILRDMKGWKGSDALYLVLGGVLGVVVCTLSPTQTPDTLWFIFLCGMVSICAMILPGISGSFLLLVMGKYEYIMLAIDGLLHFDAHSIAVVLVFGLGCVVGILAFAKLLHFLLGRWNRQTILILSGFILGSLVKVWPWSNTAAIEAAGLPAEGLPLWGAALLWCIVGAALVLTLEWLGNRRGKTGTETEEQPDPETVKTLE